MLPLGLQERGNDPFRSSKPLEHPYSAGRYGARNSQNGVAWRHEGTRQKNTCNHGGFRAISSLPRCILLAFPSRGRLPGQIGTEFQEEIQTEP